MHHTSPSQINDTHEDDFLSSSAFAARAGWTVATIFALTAGAALYGGYQFWQKNYSAAASCKNEFTAQAHAAQVDLHRASSYTVSPREIGSEGAACEAFIYGNNVRFIEWNTQTGYSYVERQPHSGDPPFGF